MTDEPSAPREVAPLEDDTSQRAEPLDTELAPRRDVVERWREQGFTADYRVVEGGRIRCDACDCTVGPDQLEVHEEFRYEGITDPGDEEILLAVGCDECEHRGTLTLGYGPSADADEAEVLRQLAASG